MLSKEKTYELLVEHFEGCIRFWERELHQNRDLDTECFSNAINDISNIKFNPFTPYEREENRLDEETVKQFIENRKLDLKGKW